MVPIRTVDARRYPLLNGATAAQAGASPATRIAFTPAAPNASATVQDARAVSDAAGSVWATLATFAAPD